MSDGPYRVEVFDHILLKDELQNILNKMAREGYELVQTNFAKFKGYQMIFKKVNTIGNIETNSKT